MLKPGDRAPEFHLRDQDGAEVSLAALLAQGPFVLYFYPADFTPGCTREACGVRDLHAELLQAGLRVVGVSPQDSASHARFRERHQLPFPLLADVDKQLIRAFGVDGPLGFGVRRASFLVGADGKIRDAVVADFRIDRHANFLRRAMELQRAARSS
jgi:peroxiredoxin Q/BCP